jgi:hypothetical protein
VTDQVHGGFGSDGRDHQKWEEVDELHGE